MNLSNCWSNGEKLMTFNTGNAKGYDHCFIGDIGTTYGTKIGKSHLEPLRQNLEIVSLFLYYFVFCLTGDDSINQFIIIPLIHKVLTTNHNRQ